MARSMTGFGRGEAADDKMKILVEMKSVNHRYLDLGIKMPKKLNAYEAVVRNILKEYIPLLCELNQKVLLLFRYLQLHLFLYKCVRTNYHLHLT